MTRTFTFDTKMSFVLNRVPRCIPRGSRQLSPSEFEEVCDEPLHFASVCCPHLALALLFPKPALAQTQTGTITGVVTDEQAAVLPGVAVTLDSPAIIRPQTLVTNDRGVYSFIALPPGAYSLKFDLQGFASPRAPRHPRQRRRGQHGRSGDEGRGSDRDRPGDGRIAGSGRQEHEQRHELRQLAAHSIPQAREIWSTVEQVPGRPRAVSTWAEPAARNRAGWPCTVRRPVSRNTP